ncbi:SDR family oxidoreductase [Mangrovicoccus algicola]|uniref:SDR family oxidoreductase n=1 Tax=Mangrovicoccus algicola TaxID=2771008 RepID=A0A8J6YYN4_9RHOB|nr:SDR family oxidoreductase [Mangrovicoccus algicola]MBE3640060.1 SDR family oxidoreductase [Mangrovicoccus algicola]
MQLTGFEGRCAFVTGAGGGIGQAAIARLRGAGARVFATDLPGALAGLSAAPDLLLHPLDVTDAAAVEAALDAAETAFGPPALAVHAAGMLETRPLLDLPPEAWDRVFAVNARGSFLVARGLAARMADRGEGAIVVIGSNSGGVPRMDMGAYGASKAAAAMLVRSLGLEVARQGVRVNLVAPGSTLTPMLSGMWDDPEAGAARVVAGNPAQYRTGIPLGKLASPDDIAAAAMFLLSREAGHVTMADLYVDGGATLRA